MFNKVVITAKRQANNNYIAKSDTKAKATWDRDQLGMGTKNKDCIELDIITLRLLIPELCRSVLITTLLYGKLFQIIKKSKLNIDKYCAFTFLKNLFFIKISLVLERK